MDERCDGKVDCQDLSDEEDCQAFISFPGYNKHLVPPPVGNDSTLKMNISLTINDIISIDENGGYFKTKITLVRTWINTQLTYLNLKKNIAQNQMSSDDIRKMWRPWTVFENMEQLDDYKATDLNDIMIIIPRQE